MPDSLDLRGGFDIETPEQVAFRLERAGLGARTLAALLDSLFLAAAYFGVFVIMGALGVLGGLTDDDAPVWLVGLLIVISTFLLWGYYIGFEIAWNGQTPGKRILGIRVVGDGGVPVTPGQVVIRNLVRLIDFQFAYAVGMISIFVSRDEKRVGDHAAGTVVVSERRPSANLSHHGVPTASGRNVDPRLLDLIRDYWARSGELDRQTRHRIGRDLANRLAEELGRPAVTSNRVEAELQEMTRMVLGKGD